MTIESATPAAQYEVRRRAVQAADATQTFANRADPITAAQAASIDTALAALLAALTAAGFGPPVDPTKATVSNGSTVPLQTSAGVSVGAGAVTVASGAVTNVKLPATAAVVASGLSPIAATGTGTKVTFTVANGALTGIALSA